LRRPSKEAWRWSDRKARDKGKSWWKPGEELMERCKPKNRRRSNGVATGMMSTLRDKGEKRRRSDGETIGDELALRAKEERKAGAGRTCRD
jgi:hypothetical protein